MIILGIDPGQTGGLAVVDGDDGTLITARAMPVTVVGKKKSLDIRAALNWTWVYDNIDVGVIEQVSAMPKQGVSSSFQFGRMYGGAEAIMYEATERQEYVTSRVWKKAMGLSNDKGASLDLATRLFGQECKYEYWPLKKNDGVAEAALIALWWVRKYT